MNIKTIGALLFLVSLSHYLLEAQGEKINHSKAAVPKTSRATSHASQSTPHVVHKQNSAANLQLIQDFLRAVKAIPESAAHAGVRQEDHKNNHQQIKKAVESYKKLFKVQHELILTKKSSKELKQAVIKLFKSTNIKGMPWHPLAKNHTPGQASK